MAKIILKCPYYKPNSKRNFQNFVKYIATRDGVVQTKNPDWNSPASEKQIKLINSMLEQFPKAKNSFEFEDYNSSKTVGNAHQLINYIIENEMVDRSKYVKYIAERPRVEKYSTHGLFSSTDEPISLAQVSKEIAESNSNVWTHIISLKREDAERLNYNNVDAWRNLLMKDAMEIAKQMHIAPNNFRWYAAFHNEGHHPHVHMIAYSIKPNEAYLSKKGIENIRSTLATDIFKQDLISIYTEKDEQREKIKASAKELIGDIISKINTNTFDDPQIENLLIEIANRLSKISGKKQYGYLKADLKNLVDEVMNLIAKDEKIANLYDLWYQKKTETIRIYTDEVPEMQKMSEVKDFKPIKNMIVQMAMEIKNDIDIIDTVDIEPVKNQAPKSYLDYLLKRFEDKNADTAYLIGRFYATEDGFIDYKQAEKFYLYAGQNGNPNGYYQLGVLYYYGAGEIERDVSKAEEYLQLAAEQNNEAAKHMLYSINHHRQSFIATSSIRFLHYVSQLIKRRQDQARKPSGTDKKEREKTNDKKQAQGLRISMEM